MTLEEKYFVRCAIESALTFVYQNSHIIKVKNTALEHGALDFKAILTSTLSNFTYTPLLNFDSCSCTLLHKF